jgi:hypothetical protein
MQISVDFNMTNFGKASKASVLSSSTVQYSIMWDQNKAIHNKIDASLKLISTLQKKLAL